MRYLVLLTIGVVLFFAACVKPDGAHPFTGGKGGKAIIRASPYNGNSGIWLHKGTIYIKYATWDPPADSVYDDSVECVKTDTMITAVFKGLKAGDYYLFARGYDSTSPTRPVYVQGGIKFIFESEGVYTVNVAAIKP